MIIHRGALPHDNFTIVPNAVIRSGLSYKALGMYVSLSSHREGWNTTVAQLAEDAGCSKDAVTTCVRELEKAGLLILDRVRNESGRYESNYTLTCPENQDRTDPENQDGTCPGKPVSTCPENQDAIRRPSEKTMGGAQPAPTPAPKAKGHRLPEGWLPSREDVEAVREDFPDLDTRVHHKQFMDHWLSAATRATKTNWGFAWRVWMRKEGKIENEKRARDSRYQQNRGARVATDQRTGVMVER